MGTAWILVIVFEAMSLIAFIFAVLLDEVGLSLYIKKSDDFEFVEAERIDHRYSLLAKVAYIVAPTLSFAGLIATIIGSLI